MIRSFEISLHNYRAMFISKRQIKDQNSLFQMIYKGKISNDVYKAVALQLSVATMIKKFHMYSYPSMILAIKVM